MEMSTISQQSQVTKMRTNSRRWRDINDFSNEVRIMLILCSLKKGYVICCDALYLSVGLDV